MNAAIICPGPSVSKTFDDDFAGLRIAVNRAALWYASDVWAANDFPLICEISDDVKGNPRLWCNHDTVTSLLRRGNCWGKGATAFSSLVYPVPAWHLYTAPAALVVAAFLGADRIEVFGADWTSEPDADGKTPPSCRRTEGRWRQERSIWEGIVACLKERGVRVERIRP